MRSAISRPSFATTFNRVCPNADALLSDDEVAAVQAPVARQQSAADRAAFEAVVHRVEKVLRIGTSSLRATLAEDQAVLSSFADILTLDPLPSGPDRNPQGGGGVVVLWMRCVCWRRLGLRVGPPATPPCSHFFPLPFRSCFLFFLVTGLQTRHRCWL